MPIKTLSIPRLELQTAVLGVHLSETVQNYHRLPIARRIFWSDSSTVLAWIRSDHRRYQKFVAVRIGEILSASNPEEWRWVPSEMNVADKATKWNNGPNFRPDNPWFRGPPFLQKTEEHWLELPQPFTTKEELRPNHIHWTSTPAVDVTRFSQWTKLQRTMGYVYRFIANIQKKLKEQDPQNRPLSQDELKLAEICLLNYTVRIR